MASHGLLLVRPYYLVVVYGSLSFAPDSEAANGALVTKILQPTGLIQITHRSLSRDS